MFNVFLTIFLFIAVFILFAGESIMLDILKKEQEANETFRKFSKDIYESQLKHTQLVDKDLDKLIAAINNLAEEQDQTKKTVAQALKIVMNSVYGLTSASVDILHGECLKANVDKQEAPKKKSRKKKAKDIPEETDATVSNREDLEKL